MAPRASSKRKPSGTDEKPVKKAPSITSVTTSTTVSTSKRRSQPLAPSTSQNSVTKPTSAKHKARKPSSSQPSSLPSPSSTRPSAHAPLVEEEQAIPVALEGQKLNVYVFGSGSMGELGLGPREKDRNVKRPRLNPHLLPDKVGIVDIAVGGMHCAAIDDKGRVWTWGVNDQGVLGRDTTWTPDTVDGDVKMSLEADSDSEDEDEEMLNPKESVPGLVEGFPEGVKIEKIACGDSITVAVTTEGAVYAWGTFRCSEGLLGFSPETRIATRPTLVPILKNIVQVACGVDHVLALSSTGRLYSWGNGQQLQLGRRVVERTRFTNLVPREFGLKSIRAIGAGSYHSFAISTTGKVYAWGLNQFGQCGIDRQGSVGEDGAVISSPSTVESLGGYDVVSITGGEHHSLALTSDGQLLAWGRMDCNQLGIPESSPPEGVVVDSRGKARFTAYPSVVPNIPPMEKVFCGSHHNVGISSHGSAWSWGYGEVWQVGQGPHTSENPSGDIEVPTRIVNTATNGVRMVCGGAGGQFSVLCGFPVNANIGSLNVPNAHGKRR